MRRQSYESGFTKNNRFHKIIDQSRQLKNEADSDPYPSLERTDAPISSGANKQAIEEDQRHTSGAQLSRVTVEYPADMILIEGAVICRITDKAKLSQ